MNQMVRPQAVESTVKLVEALAGMVEQVTFHNAGNGFCVLKVQAGGKRDLMTVVNHPPSIGTGEWVTATGAWVSDRVYGLQLRANVAAGDAHRTAQGDRHRGQRRQHQTAMD